MNIEQCIAYATKKHAGQTRKEGTPYIEHPLWVMRYLKEKGYDETYQVAGLFHDLLEDTDATKEEILKLTNEEVLQVVILVTKEKGYSHKAYLQRIMSHPIAKEVKIADRMHNLSSIQLPQMYSFCEHYLKDTEQYLPYSKELQQSYQSLKEAFEGCKYNS